MWTSCIIQTLHFEAELFFLTLTDSGSATESPTNPGGTEAPTDPGTEAPTGPVGECQILPHCGNIGCGHFK